MSANCTSAERRLPPLPLRLLGLLAVAFLCAAPARAQHVKFSASVEPQQVVFGEPITLTLSIESAGNVELGDFVMPDLGGLTASGEQGRSTQTTDAQGQRTITQRYTFGLTAPAPGEYTISPAQLMIDGRPYRTQPVKVTVNKQPTLSLPDDLAQANILDAQTRDPGLARQLRGRIFVKTEVSNPNPWVGEPVIVSYYLYTTEGVPLSGRVDKTIPNGIQGAVTTVLVDPTQYQMQKTQVGGRDFSIALAYRLSVTPNTAGPLQFGGFELQVGLNDSRRGGNSFPLFGFDTGIPVKLPTAPITLNVKPLPSPPPDNFTGTIGDFTIAGTIDRESATEDDLITLSVALKGRGAIELANAPTLPAMSDFELNGQSSSVATSHTSEELQGEKTFEFVLRPMRSGTLEIPAIPYTIFDPYAGEYKSLEIPAQRAAISPGKNPALPQIAGSAAGTAQNQPATLQYLEPLDTLDRARCAPLLESPAFWSGQVLLGALFCGAFVRRRRLDRLDPAQKRRARAWQTFERRLREAPMDQPLRAAEILDQATRGFIADRANTSPEGLTRPEIERLLNNGRLSGDNVARLCDLLEELQALRYSPVQPTREDVESRAQALRTLLREEV